MAIIETTLEEMREIHDWKEAFSYSGNSNRVIDDKTVSLKRFDLEDIGHLALKI